MDQQPDTIDMMSDDDLRDELRSKLDRLDFIETRFRHMNVNSQDGTDICKKCGLDIRDPIHERVRE